MAIGRHGVQNLPRLCPVRLFLTLGKHLPVDDMEAALDRGVGTAEGRGVRQQRCQLRVRLGLTVCMQLKNGVSMMALVCSLELVGSWAQARQHRTTKLDIAPRFACHDLCPDAFQARKYVPNAAKMVCLINTA